MAFRDPVTTAEGVDTGPTATGPGVRMFQLLDETGATLDRGVVEFRTGLAGDLPAVLELEPFIDVPDPEFARSFGNVFRLRGAATNGADAAELQLVIEENPAGGYRSAAYLLADRLVLPRGVEAPLGAVTQTRSTVGVQTTGPAEARLGGGHNIASAPVLRGRAYEAVYVGNLNAAGTAGRILLNVRAAAANTTPTTSSPIAASAVASLTVVGGAGQETIATVGQPFQVSADMSIALHCFAANAAGGTSTAGIGPAGSLGEHGILLRDVGPATSTTRTLL